MIMRLINVRKLPSLLYLPSPRPICNRKVPLGDLFDCHLFNTSYLDFLFNADCLSNANALNDQIKPIQRKQCNTTKLFTKFCKIKNSNEKTTQLLTLNLKYNT